VDAEGRVIGEGDAYAQAAFILQKIERALREAGAGLRDVVRTRMYLVSLDDEKAVGRAHAEVFGEIRPAATMIQIAGLVDKRLRVEIEVEAYAEG
jgi:enamine deaminase RidA (YjgF/YER057c/UK114 family)